MPYQKVEGKPFDDFELFRYMILVEDDFVFSTIDSLLKIVYIRQRDINIITEKVNAILSDYLENDESKNQKSTND